MIILLIPMFILEGINAMYFAITGKSFLPEDEEND